MVVLCLGVSLSRGSPATSSTATHSQTQQTLSVIGSTRPTQNSWFKNDQLGRKSEVSNAWMQADLSAFASLPFRSPAASYQSDAVQQPKQKLSVTSDPSILYTNDPVAEFAQRSQIPQAKLPIPRLPRHNIQPASKSSSPSASSSAASTPPPSTPTPSAGPRLNSSSNLLYLPNPMHLLSPHPLPPPSHLQALHAPIRATLPSGDCQVSGKKIKNNVRGDVPVKGTVDAEDGEVHVIDERGFVDGVKVARKWSKANVLGKAVEYIRVLKKREIRLKTEQSGLKMLWERRGLFGGEEKDEVEGEPDVEGDDEDSEGGDDGDEEEAGRKRERGEVAPVRKEEKEKKETKPVVHTSTQPGEPDTVPEKRKRGRPRKVPALMPPPPVIQQQQQRPQEPMKIQMQMQQQQQQQQQCQPQQYLLAVFAVFLFFNDPYTSSSPSHAAHYHTGMVLTPPLAHAPNIVSQFPSATPVPSVGWGWREYIQVFHIAVPDLVLGNLLTSWICIAWSKSDVKKRARSTSVSRPSEKDEKVDRVKVAEETILHGDDSKLSIYIRYQIYRAITSARSATINELSTLAMVLQGTVGVVSGIAHAKFCSIWDTARSYAEHAAAKPGSHSKAKISEELVLAELDVAGAIDRLTTSSVDVKGGGERVYSPLEVLTCSLVRERVKGP
ncbi:hypothetical protein BDQ12DRAFT_720328 [Crucibulum laeve]|uniref:BHLH domain-containing protein n=1 Tax=Crucibulum laeve TaxID=68775 RepID=A0A5C3M9C8_9AGAR|nr:hypothetical protein BDQ12DRAFT_720328 [Crucibulum laeve]